MKGLSRPVLRQGEAWVQNMSPCFHDAAWRGSPTVAPATRGSTNCSGKGQTREIDGRGREYREKNQAGWQPRRQILYDNTTRQQTCETWPNAAGSTEPPRLPPAAAEASGSSSAAAEAAAGSAGTDETTLKRVLGLRIAARGCWGVPRRRRCLRPWATGHLAVDSVAKAPQAVCIEFVVAVHRTGWAEPQLSVLLQPQRLQ